MRLSLKPKPQLLLQRQSHLCLNPIQREQMIGNIVQNSPRKKVRNKLCRIMQNPSQNYGLNSILNDHIQPLKPQRHSYLISDQVYNLAKRLVAAKRMGSKVNLLLHLMSTSKHSKIKLISKGKFQTKIKQSRWHHHLSIKSWLKRINIPAKSLSLIDIL